MPREYRHIQLYETEIIRLKKEGKTLDLFDNPCQIKDKVI